MNIQRIDKAVIDTEYIILENIYDSGGRQVRQRDLAHIAGTSLGMTNSILKRLAQKGWISIKKLNSRNIQYAITLEGINEIIHRSYRYFKRTIRNVVFFKKILEDLVHHAKLKKINTVILVGVSDLDFIVEHACRRWSMNFVRESEKSMGIQHQNTLRIYAEGIANGIADGNTDGTAEMSKNQKILLEENKFFLSSLIIKQAATKA